MNELNREMKPGPNREAALFQAAAQTERDKAHIAQKEAERSRQAEKEQRLRAETREAEAGHLLYV